MKDYYAILGVTPDANPETIRKAYLQRARTWHPDVAGCDEETAVRRFQELNAAYAALTDRDGREDFDRRMAHFRHETKVVLNARWRPAAKYRRKARKRRKRLFRGGFFRPER